MNTSLYRSPHALGALALVAGFGLWAHRTQGPLGWQLGVDRTFLLWSGWTALALYLVLWAYAARKAAHRTRSPLEFARAVPIEALERAQTRLSDLRVDALAGRATDAATLRMRARRILAEEAVDGVVAVAVTPARSDAPPRLDVRWRMPLGRLARWLHTHLYYGAAAAVLVPLHGGMRFTSPMSVLLNGLSVAVLATGFAGIALWTFGPRWLSAAERDLNLERAAALRGYYRDKIAALAAQPDDEGTRARDLATLRGQQQGVERACRRIGRRRAVLHGWRLVHVPLSILLLLVVTVHVLSVWIY